MPFSIAANVGVSPQLIRVNGQGSANRIPIKLAGPADIQKVGGGYRLLPTTVILPQGRLTATGVTGPSGISGSARLEGVDLSIAQAFAPTLGIAGKASGVADFSLPKGGAMPTVRTQLQVTGFTRSSLTTVSEPVDVALLATLAQSGADAHAVVRRRGVVVGRLQAKLSPIPGGAAPWLQRLKAAPISGGLRYDGPSKVLWGLSGIGGAGGFRPDRGGARRLRQAGAAAGARRHQGAGAALRQRHARHGGRPHRLRRPLHRHPAGDYQPDRKRRQGHGGGRPATPTSRRPRASRSTCG